MGRSVSLYDQITEQNGRKKFVQTIAFTTSGGLTTLNTTDVYGKPIPDGATLVLQGDQDFLYELRNANAAASAVTVSGGARPGLRVTQYSQEFVIRHSTGGTYGADTKLDVIGASASGNLSVFWVS